MKLIKSMINLILLVALVGGLSLVTSGCKKDEEPAKKGPAKPTAAKPAAAQPGQPGGQKAETPAGDEKKKGWTLELGKEDKRDPFAIVVRPEETEVQGDVTQLYDLDQMILQLIILDESGAGNDKAFIKIPSDPSGNSDRVVTKNSPLGKQNGVVHAIYEDRIEVKEQWFDPDKEQPIINIRTMEIYDPNKARKR